MFLRGLGVNDRLDALKSLIAERLKCRFHPYLSETARWRHYPTHMAKLLETLNPLHVISVTDKIVVVDGVFVEDNRPLREKYHLAVEAVSAMFGDAEEKLCVAANCEVALHRSGVASISLYWGSVWYIAPSTLLKLPRFAYATDPNNGLFAREREYDGDYVNCYALVEEKPVATVHVNKSFFLDPKLGKVRLFGDLCFLSQINEKWNVNEPVDLEVFPPRFGQWEDTLKCTAEVLKHCVGLKSLVSHGYKELLLRDTNESQVNTWKSLLKVLEA